MIVKEKSMNKPITITLEPPITEYCSKCDYKYSGSQHSYRDKCPVCGESVNKYHKPKINFATVTKGSEPKSYNLLGYREKSIKYYFRIPNQKGFSITIDTNYAIDIYNSYTPLSIAEELLEILKSKYWYNSRIKELEIFIDVLRNREEYDEIEKNKYDIQVAKEKLYWLLRG